MKIVLSKEQLEHWNIHEKICCVYKVTNLIDNKVYIGQTKDLRKRLSRYHTQVHDEKYLGSLIIRTMRYFGEDNFQATIVEECEPKQLNEKEKFWIDKLKTTDPKYGYNMLNGITKKYSTLANERKAKAHMHILASSDSKRKRSNRVLAISENGFILADSGKLLGDYLHTTKDMIKNALRAPSSYKGWYIYYDDINKRNEIREKVEKKNSVRSKKYLQYLDFLDDYEYESVETIYRFIITNIGQFYKLDYDYISSDGRPFLLKISDVVNGDFYIEEG